MTATALGLDPLRDIRHRDARLARDQADWLAWLELFARRQRLGWDTWGNEALEHVSMGRTCPQRWSWCGGREGDEPCNFCQDVTNPSREAAA